MDVAFTERNLNIFDIAYLLEGLSVMLNLKLLFLVFICILFDQSHFLLVESFFQSDFVNFILKFDFLCHLCVAF